MSQSQNDYSTYAVFTPTTQARLNFVSRSTVENSLTSALRTPGKQIVIYGESGSGKSTLLVNALEELRIRRITTRCSSSSTFEKLVLDAFDQLDVFFADAYSSSKEKSSQATAEAQFHAIKLQIANGETSSRGVQEKRILPPQLTQQRLGYFMGARSVCWVIEDFHKVPDEHKTDIAQTLKIFSDLGAEYPDLRIICIGATDTAREVVQYDKEMKNRVSEIHVPLMNDRELRSILDNGSSLLNVDIAPIATDIVAFSSGLASVTHHLALNACLDSGIESTRSIRIRLDATNMKAAVARYIEESSDTLKALFDAALVRQRERRYHNPQLLLEALASGPIEGMSHAEIRNYVQVHHHADYPAGNVTTYLRQLQGAERGSIVRQAADGKYRFRDPIMHSYARALFNVGTGWPGSLFDLINQQLRVYVSAASNSAESTFEEWIIPLTGDQGSQ